MVLCSDKVVSFLHFPTSTISFKYLVAVNLVGISNKQLLSQRIKETCGPLTGITRNGSCITGSILKAEIYC